MFDYWLLITVFQRRYLSMTENSMIAQVESLPGMIRDELDALDARVRRLMDHNEYLSVKRVVITGCGDSHMAGLATELAFETLSGIPTEPMTAMQAARYGLPYQPKSFPRNPLVLGISVSGTVARTREALAIARAEGALTVAITATPDAPLAQAAEKMLDCTVPDFAFAPGVRSYRVSLLSLYLLAIRLAEIQGRLTQEEANALRQELKGTADAIEATIEAVNTHTRQLAEAVADQKEFVFTGAPTFFISPGARGHSRVAELVEPVKRVGRILVAVVPQGDEAIAPQADWVLPVVGNVREIFSPMVYAIAGELFAAHLSDVVGEPFFRGFSEVYDVEKYGGNTIRNSQVVDRQAF
jgi:glucosamine--fructose-6-phosphate aminotransferase (isomerizing)